MPHAQASITIARPVKAVYEFVMKGENNPLWRPKVLEVERVAGKPAAAGAVFKQQVKGFFGRRTAADYELTQCVPSKTIRYRLIAGRTRSTGTYSFRASSGSTVITYRLDLETTGFAMLRDPLINRSFRSEVRTLANLKEYLESQG
jgi:hypothetical protein